MEDRISHAQFLIESAKYDEAAQIIHQVIDDSNATINERADAFQLLGLLAQIYPMSIGNDNAFSYYKQALELLPDHLGSLMGIVMTYGNHAPDHQDYNAFESVMKKLLKRLDELDESALECHGAKTNIMYVQVHYAFAHCATDKRPRLPCVHCLS